MSSSHSPSGKEGNGGKKVEKTGVLVCPRCGRAARRLLPLPFPRRPDQTAQKEPVVCERCLRDLEKEYTDEENAVLPPE